MFMVELIFEILAGYGVPDKYPIFSDYDCVYMWAFYFLSYNPF